MRTLLILIFALMMGTPMATHAQSDDAEAAAAEEAAEREALRAELEAARRDMAEAAQKLARIQRQLIDEERMSALLNEKLGPLDEERLRRIERIEIHSDVPVVDLIRPRLGVLLGGRDEANEIVAVTPGSGAEKAGIRAGDRLVSINGESVDASQHSSLRTAMDGIEAGDSVPVEVERDGERMTIDVTVSSPARDFRVITHDIKGPPPAPDAPDAPDAPRMDRHVIVLEGERHWMPEPPMPPLPPSLAGLGRNSDMISNHAGLESYFGTAEGVVVLRIDADNPLKLEDGDVVLSIDGESVSRPVDIGRALLGRRGETVTLEIMRGGERITLDAELPEARAVSALIDEFHRGL